MDCGSAEKFCNSSVAPKPVPETYSFVDTGSSPSHLISPKQALNAALTVLGVNWYATITALKGAVVPSWSKA